MAIDVPPWTVLLAIALAGVLGFLALEQLWLGIRRRAEPLHFWCAAVSVDALLYLLARTLQALSLESEPALVGLASMHSAALLLVPLGLSTLRAGLGRPSRRIVTLFAIGALALVAVVWFTPAFLGATAQPRENLLGQRYWAAQPTPWAAVLGGYYFLGFLFVSVTLLRQRFRPNERRAAAVLTALVLLAGMNDLLLNVGVRTFHLLEYAFALVAIGLDNIIVRRMNAELEDALSSATHAEAQARSLIQNAPDAIFVHRDGRLVFANATAARYLGHASAHELVGLELSSLRTDEPAPTGTPADEWCLRTRSGASVRGEVVELPLEFDGQPATMLRVRDLTDLRRVEAHLALSTRMASVGTLAAGVAHEINNPLSYLLTNLELAERQTRGPADGASPEQTHELGQLLSDALAGVGRVAKIVRDLKTLSRADETTVKPVALEAVIDSCIGVAWNEIRHRAGLRREFVGECFVKANESRLAQVFLNLLVNAAQSIEAGRASENEIVVRTQRRGEGSVVAEVSDTGCGIEPALVDRIFEPFVTTKPVGAGTGLGLSICHRIVSDLGGAIEVESRPGRGSTFRVVLRSVERRSTAPPSVRPSRHDASRPARVLVVDDEAMIRRSLGRSLRHHDLTFAEGGREAIELCSEATFDVVLCDLMMPDVTGMDVFEAVCAANPDYASRFVFMTGGAFTQRAREFVDTSGCPTLDKPLALAEIEELVRERVPGPTPEG